MSERDELEAIVASRGGHVKATTSAILAAGYRKPRTITTAEELDALRAGSVIRDPLTCIKWGSGEWGTFSGDSVSSSRINLPATVLHEGAQS